MPLDSPALRITFAVDAWISGAAGIATLLLAAALAPMLGLGEIATVAVGLFMLAYAAALGGLARWRGEHRRWGRTIAVGNALWVAASVWMATTPLLQPTPWGRALILGQAIAVALLALAQWRAAARASSP